MWRVVSANTLVLALHNMATTGHVESNKAILVCPRIFTYVKRYQFSDLVIGFRDFQLIPRQILTFNNRIFKFSPLCYFLHNYDCICYFVFSYTLAIFRGESSAF